MGLITLPRLRNILEEEEKRMWEAEDVKGCYEMLPSDHDMAGALVKSEYLLVSCTRPARAQASSKLQQEVGSSSQDAPQLRRYWLLGGMTTVGFPYPSECPYFHVHMCIIGPNLINLKMKKIGLWSLVEAILLLYTSLGGTVIFKILDANL